jgi:hypothetical protein
MRYIDNRYCIGKVRRLFKEAPESLKDCVVEFCRILEEVKASCGEPSYSIKEDFFKIWSGYYNRKTEFMILRHKTIFTKESFELKVEFKFNKEVGYKKYSWEDRYQAAKDISEWQNKPDALPPDESFRETIRGYNEYGTDWSSYCCNEVSKKCIEKALTLYDEFCFLREYGFSISTYAVADGGHAYKRPPDTSRSGVTMTISYQNKDLEIELSEYNGVMTVETMLITEGWNEEKNQHENEYYQHYDSEGGENINSYSDIKPYIDIMAPGVLRGQKLEDILGN